MTKWFEEAKYGLFIHFGLYSMLAGEYKGRKTDRIAEWIMNNFAIPAEEYEVLMKDFNPEKFLPMEIARKCTEWGMKYIVLTSKHHEGFANFNSACSPYNSVNACGRDLVGELKEACRAYGLKFGLYYSQAQDWHDPDGAMKCRPADKIDYQAYLDRKCMPQLREIMEQYNPDLIWFDTPMDTTPEQSEKMVQLVRSYNPDVVISGRIGNGLGDYMTTGDNFIPRLPYDGLWEVPATINDTWGYNRYDKNWKDPYDIIKLLVKINARGGNYLLNVGPMGDGSIPEESIAVLDTVGKYVTANAEAIYGTQNTGIYPYELDFAEFTCKPQKLFVHVFKPKIRFELLNIANRFTNAYLVETGEKLDFRVGYTCEGHDFVEIEIPERLRDKAYYAVCLEYPEERPIYSDLKL
ncbi:MAG: alpha-L-fucosidase [Clostridia bacterium]|nr:alpha-L-fucosidase [Clostridia bacterium]